MRGRLREIGDAAESMEYDCTHDGGVTEPQCRTLGSAREPDGLALASNLDFFRNGMCAEASHLHESRGCHPDIPLTNRPSYIHRLLRRLVAAACCSTQLATRTPRRLALSVTSASNPSWHLLGLLAVLCSVNTQTRHTCLT